jgi:hypothetical protein
MSILEIHHPRSEDNDHIYTSCVGYISSRHKYQLRDHGYLLDKVGIRRKRIREDERKDVGVSDQGPRTQQHDRLDLR